MKALTKSLKMYEFEHYFSQKQSLQKKVFVNVNDRNTN